MTSKREMRAIVRQRKKSFSAEELIEKSIPLMKRLCSHPKVIAAQTIMIYASLPDEVQTIDTIEKLWKSGKRMLLPEVVNETDMRLRVYEGPSSLQEGHFHILEPIGAICEENEEIDVAIVPGMGFDYSGHRLGRGKGFYDRFLRHIQTYKIGICFDFQIMNQIPTDEYDVLMDEVLW